MKGNKEFCKYILENNLVKPYDIIKHSFCKSRLKDKKLRIENSKNNDLCCTLPTRADMLGVVVYE